MPKRCQAPSFQFTLTLGGVAFVKKVGESENNKISLQTCTRSEGPVRVTDNPIRILYIRPRTCDWNAIHSGTRIM